MSIRPKPPIPEKWKERLTRSGYFFSALLLHLVLFLMLATFIIFKAPVQRPDNATFLPVSVKPPPPPPTPPAAGSASANAMEPQITVTPPPTITSTITTTAPNSFSINAVKVDAPNLPASLSEPSGSGLTGHGISGAGDSTGNPFGSTSGSDQTLIGTLYDFTRTQDGKAVTMASFQSIVSDFIKNSWQPGDKYPCYKSPRKVYANHILIPVTPDEIAGAAFHSPESSHAFWLVHYHAVISPNISARFRFIGFGDNVLIVSIDGTVVLDASDHQYLGKKFSKLVGQMNITGPGKASTTPLFSGDWFSMSTAESHKVDIVLGDEGGVTTSGLFIQTDDAELKFAPSGAPLLPLFVIGALTDGEQATLGKILPPECLKGGRLILNGMPDPDAVKNP